ncbi:hypothetical protein SBA3_3860004 [Candidatus Sulfopaludibacter sp. SbA3]|nr:hypothetical protein SBA3_3860004 [Candidatus Sulfopaludibacter sp. SbA3]
MRALRQFRSYQRPVPIGTYHDVCKKGPSSSLTYRDIPRGPGHSAATLTFGLMHPLLTLITNDMVGRFHGKVWYTAGTPISGLSGWNVALWRCRTRR